MASLTVLISFLVSGSQKIKTFIRKLSNIATATFSRECISVSVNRWGYVGALDNLYQPTAAACQENPSVLGLHWQIQRRTASIQIYVSC